MESAQIKRLRKGLGLTQNEFAAQLGVTRVTVTRWETGAVRITGPAAVLLAALSTGLKAETRRKAKRRR